MSKSDISTRVRLMNEARMPPGRPRKRAATRNTNGLRNKKTISVADTESLSSPSTSDGGGQQLKRARTYSRTSETGTETDLQVGSDSDSDLDWECPTVFDGLKFIANHDDSDDESEAGSGMTFGGMDNDEFCARLVDLAISAGDDPVDEDWLPPREARRAAQ